MYLSDSVSMAMQHLIADGIPSPSTTSASIDPSLTTSPHRIKADTQVISLACLHFCVTTVALRWDADC
jgi:hypothetical protein